MRTLVLALLLASTAISPAAAASRNFGITGFDRIRVDGPFKVTLTTGIAPFASATGSSAALDRVAVEMQGRTLIVHANPSSWGGYPGEGVGPVEVQLGTHELRAAWLNGSGTLQINRISGLLFDLAVQGSGSVDVAEADVDQLKVGLSGTVGSTIAGRAGMLKTTVRGISTLDASGLVTKDATIGAQGAATIRANVTNSAKIDATGPATVTLAGGPACTAQLQGSASVSGCR